MNKYSHVLLFTLIFISVSLSKIVYFLPLIESADLLSLSSM